MVGSSFTKSEINFYILCNYTSASGLLSYYFYFNSTYDVFIFNILSEDAESAHSSVTWGGVMINYASKASGFRSLGE